MKAALDQFGTSPSPPSPSNNRLSLPVLPKDAGGSTRSLLTSSGPSFTMSSSAPKYSVFSEPPKQQQRPGDYDVIKMKYLRSLNITANGPISIPAKKVKEESIASSAPIPIPTASRFARADSDEESSDTETSNSNSELELSPALMEPKKPSKAKNFVPPHELTHTPTSGSSLINHSLPSDYREKHRNRGI